MAQKLTSNYTRHTICLVDKVWVDVTYRYCVRGASVDVKGRGVVVGDGSSGQCCWRGEANCVAAI